MNLDQQIVDLKQKLEDLKTRKIQNETKLKSLEEEKQQLLQECKALNTDPQHICTVIEDQEKIISEEIIKLQFQLKQFNGNSNYSKS